MELKKGDTVNKLTLIEDPYFIRQKGGVRKGMMRWYVKCKCECGTVKDIAVCGLERKKGKVQSCGCAQRQQASQRSYRHGESLSGTYGSWAHMKDRCSNRNFKHYKNYGGRGIEVCEKWLNFTGFLEDMGDRPRGKTIDRIDINGNYNKENCKWSTRKEQMNNTRRSKYLTYNNKKQTITQWAREIGMPYSRLRHRIGLGWATTRAIESPCPRLEQLTYNGKTRTIIKWAKKLGIKEITFRTRLRRGWSIKRAIETK